MFVNVSVLSLDLLLEKFGDDYSRRSDQEFALLETVNGN